MAADPDTLFSALNRFASPNALSTTGIPPHPYGSSSSVATELRELVAATEHAMASLSMQLSQPWSDPKLPFTLRQRASVSAALLRSEAGVKHIVDTFNKQGENHQYGLDSPDDPKELLEWCLSRLVSWGTAVGMETFREEQTDGRLNLALAGKVLVLDMDILIDRTDESRPLLSLSGVRTSYATNGATDGPHNPGSTSLAGLVADDMRAFLRAVYASHDDRNTLWIAKLDKRIGEHLAYMMRLDRLALAEGESGLRWFTAINELAAATEAFAKAEAETVSTVQSVTQAPLDIFLSRAHTLPLPYLLTPSISFLTHISPLAYLTLLRSSSIMPTAPSPTLPVLDIPFSTLRSTLAGAQMPPGVTLATLLLAPYEQPTAIPLDSTHTERPFFLHGMDGGANADFTLPPAPAGHAWILDFTASSNTAHGVVMSQARMREVQRAVDPAGASDILSVMGLATVGGALGSWIDMLVNSAAPVVSPEYYTTIYRSPSTLHPPLKLRLQAPREPGFLLERVPVRTLREIWAILEVVKEQCWLNSLLSSCTWVPEGHILPGEKEDVDDAPATDDELHALLAGTYIPRSIPVSLSLPSLPSADSLLPGNAQLRMVCPGRGPIPGRAEISVTHDPTAIRGCRVDIGGALGGLGVDVDVEALEEVVRRGGGLGIPGRVWVSGGLK